MMNNAALKAIIAEYGNKVRSIRCTNVFVQLNQATQNIPAVTNADIQYKSYDGTDFFIVPVWDAHNQKFFDALIKTEQVEIVGCVRDPNDVLDIYCT